jgi:hypothetical protein
MPVKYAAVETALVGIIDSFGIGDPWPPSGIHWQSIPTRSVNSLRWSSVAHDHMKIPQDGLLSNGIWQVPLDSQSA